MSRIAAGPAEERRSSGRSRPERSGMVGLLRMLLVALMTCVFSTLDNAVTLVHSSGETSVNGPERCRPSAVWRRASCSTGRAASTWGRSCTA